MRVLRVLGAVCRRARLPRVRDDQGGVSDETAMIGLMLMAAVAVGFIIYGMVTGAAGRLEFGF
jgi:hypothetical protein